MLQKLKTFWLNIGHIDQDLEIPARLKFLQTLAAEDSEVRAIFNYSQKASTPNGLAKVWMIRSIGGGVFGKIWLFAKQQFVLLKNLDVDVVVLRHRNLHQNLPLWFLWRKILRRKHPKFVLDVRSVIVDISDNWKGKLEQLRFDSAVGFAFRYLDGLTIITEKMRRDLQSKFNNFEKKTCVWSSGVDPVLFDPDKAEPPGHLLELRDRFVIMYHGIFSLNRGLQQAIQAIPIVKDAHPDVLLFLLGKGPGQSEFENLVRKYSLEDHVVIHPPVAHEAVPGYIRLARAGILPFPDLDWWNASSPIKLMEYLAMAKPVILTDIAAHRSALGELKCGFFVRDHRPESIARGIATVIEKQSELDTLGTIARNAAIENFTWKKQAEEIKTYFYDLIQEN